jgi:hypothetical protein
MTDLEESLARRMDLEDERKARKIESILQACRYRQVPEELAEILADDDYFINLFMPDGLSSWIKGYLRERITENISPLIYGTIITQNKSRRDPPMSLLYDCITEAIEQMEDEE